MKQLYGNPCWTAVLVVVVGLVGACGGSGDSPTAPTGGTLIVRLTDDPADEVSEINVFISGLTVKPFESPVVRIAQEIGIVDLLTLQDSTQVLTTAAVEPGSYQFIQVDLDETQSTIVELASGVTKDLKIPSQEIKVFGGFEVLEDGTTTLTLDFDGAQSLKKRGNGEWLLQPVILQIGAVVSGS